MDSALHRLTHLRRIALMCVVLLAAVTSLSAFLRHSAAGLGWRPWPACYAQGDHAAASGAGSAAFTAVGAARLAHRITTTLSLLGAIAMVVLSVARKPILRRHAVPSMGLLTLALLLALLGVFTPGAACRRWRWPTCSAVSAQLRAPARSHARARGRKLGAQRATVERGWGEEYVARVHKKGKLTARERLARLCDAGARPLEVLTFVNHARRFGELLGDRLPLIDDLFQGASGRDIQVGSGCTHDR